MTCAGAAQDAAPGLSRVSKEPQHAEGVLPGTGPRHTDEYDDGWTAMANPRLRDHPQGGGREGRQGLGSRLPPQEGEGLSWTLPAVRDTDTLQ